MLNSHENRAARLHSAAVFYRNRGWSVIPLRGDFDPIQPKAAAMNWQCYQHKLADDSALKNWFETEKFTGLGIVCGPVSSLIVLDFDDAECARNFAHVCPDLVDTFTVRSGNRGLPHYYFHVPEAVQVRSKHTAQADLQAHGRYVVAPPTMIAGREWRVVGDAMPRTLSQADVARILSFLEAYEFVESGAAQPSVDVAASLDFAGRGAARQMSPDYLARYYRRLAVRLGRNEALFRAASFARDAGWQQHTVTELLLGLHITQSANGPHMPETPQQRRAEGLRTIASAFRYVRRASAIHAVVHGLANSIREKLLQFKQAAVARVLDGLLLAGIRAGVRFTERAACELLRVFGIGRRAVQAALRAYMGDEPVFQAVDPPLNPPKEIAHAAVPAETEPTKCIFVSGANRVKTLNGRAPRQYLMPDNSRLYRLLGVRASGSDTLTPADLRSPDAYRCALQRALIARRPGLYSRRWLSERIGVSVWTCRRYDRQINLLVQPQYQERRVSWDNLDHLPLEEDASAPNGCFLETSQGKRYPPVRGIGAHLLRGGQPVIFKTQVCNYYKIDYEISARPNTQRPTSSTIKPLICDEFHKIQTLDHAVFVTPPKNSSENSLNIACVGEGLRLSPTGTKQNIQTGSRSSKPDGACANGGDDSRLEPPAQTESPHPIQPRQFWLCPNCLAFHIDITPPAACGKCGYSQWELIPESIWRDVERCKVWWRALWRQHQEKQGKRIRPFAPERVPSFTPAQRALATRLYEQVRQRTPDHALTHGAANRLVQAHDAQAIERALWLLNQRDHITNAAGFVITVLRGKSANWAGQGKESRPAPDDHAAWLARLQQSPYANYYANADHLADTAEQGSPQGK